MSYKRKREAVTYQWRTALHWLHDKVYYDWEINELRTTVMELAEHLDLSRLADIFTEEMVNDGYYVPIEKRKIIIEVRGGVAEVAENETPFEIVIRDFDEEESGD